MNLNYPKVIHKVNNVPLISRLLNNIKAICPKPTIVVSYKGEEIIKETANRYEYVWQNMPLGTGHAVMCAKKHLGRNQAIKNIVVIPGDHPLISSGTIKNILFSHSQNKSVLTLGTIVLPHFNDDWGVFYNCGRIIRDKNDNINKIVEYKDATEEEKEVKEVNVSYYCFDTRWLWKNIETLNSNNTANEYYLTDMVALAGSQGYTINSFSIQNPYEGMGVNTPKELAIIERYIRDVVPKFSMKK